MDKLDRYDLNILAELQRIADGLQADLKKTEK